MFLFQRVQMTQLLLSALFCIFLCFPKPLHAHKPFFNFTNVSTEQGLGTPYVIKVLQDKQGFIWVGTQLGLYRYDGYEFKKYHHDPDDATSLAHNYVNTLFVDSAGGLWVGTNGGVLHQYQSMSDNFTRFPFDKHYPNTSRSNSVIMSIAQGDDNSLWVATLGGGLSQFDLASKQFIKNVSHNPQDDNSLSDDRVYVVLQATDGLVWMGTRDGGLNAFNPVTGEFKHYRHHPSKPQSLSHNKVYTLLEDSKGTLWVGTRGGGLNRFNPTDESFTRFQHHPDSLNSLSSNRVMAIVEDNAGTLWVGTYGNGLNRYNPDTQSFSRYIHDPLNKKSLANNGVFSITQDQSGNLWLGTFGGGLSYFNPDSQRFGLNRHQPGNPNSLSNADIRAIYKDKSGILWVGSTVGLDRYDEVKDQWLHYQTGNKERTEPEPEFKSDLKSEPGYHQSLSALTLSDNDVLAIFEDSFGVLWVGTGNGGLNRVKRVGENGEPLKPKDYRFVHYEKLLNNPNSLSDDFVKVIHEDSAKQLWVGTENGLNRFNRAQNNFTRFTHDKDKPDSLSDNIIYSLFTDNQGRLWVGTENGGLNLFVEDKTDKNNYAEPSQQGFVRFQHQSDDDNSLSDNTIFSIAQDSKGLLWLGTFGGLNRFNSETQTATHFRVKDGLITDLVMNVMIDKADNIWLGGNGIALLRSEVINQQEELNITKHIGAEADCATNQGASFQAQNGRLYWGELSQYCAFYPEQAIKASQPPMMAFTDFKLLNKSVVVSQKDKPSPLLQAINQTPAITLNHKQNIFSFEFSALHFANPKANQYQYKLEGFNNDWIETDWKNRRATYTNLAAGNYTFKVKASNNEGLWNEQGRSIELTILPPPWKTWWAYSIYGLMLLGLVWYFIRSQRQQVIIERKMNRQLEDIVSVRTGELGQKNKALNEALENLEKVSLTDQLTGANNRRFLSKFIVYELAKLKREHFDTQLDSPSNLGFIMLDIDDFKSVNDTHGHDAGDQVLIQLVEVITRTCREADWVVRWGGEEFVVVAKFSNRDELHSLAERIRNNIAETEFNLGNDQTIQRTVSMGIASYPFLKKQFDALSWEQTLSLADLALYAAKDSGRNAWISLFENDNSDVQSFDFQQVLDNFQLQIEQGAVCYESSVNLSGQNRMALS